MDYACSGNLRRNKPSTSEVLEDWIYLSDEKKIEDINEEIKDQIMEFGTVVNLNTVQAIQKDIFEEIWMAHNRYLKDWETLDNITKNHKKSYDTFSDAANIARRRQHHNSRSLYPNAIKGGVDTFYPDVDDSFIFTFNISNKTGHA
ncbi:hypothetical protein GLOIN_2v1772276 [Rhizophagus irregularis DAOM 181602=DAOM 197198]|uniref:Uncharacterized protein n=1 Tax=Rhizophagus irregularis (strain DAOM 181602 / DAOM 197198 / MUCL 43194) TaxID=747089 RepID=A0A2P4Q7K6_RHIID|nr:hypothetical protein GLOIN_2v1772276 [Rhizophagus irregularis DAOM 181602=DAOM 197198]POG73617.1 hypothetical protein GLOIN_2v1772276 [Rhizophagus irregularis DAOM 181602=DAOM 197198]|eukprot:XP_025180483.1 hypothetical protein GLOIN_2v1772276 [Rhizophagus irregularis DAOM 181602=DAOM 197198]